MADMSCGEVLVGGLGVDTLFMEKTLTTILRRDSAHAGLAYLGRNVFIRGW